MRQSNHGAQIREYEIIVQFVVVSQTLIQRTVRNVSKYTLQQTG